MKKYLVWTDYGCDGWNFTEYDTLEEAIKHETYGQDKIITTEVKYDIVEK